METPRSRLRLWVGMCAALAVASLWACLSTDRLFSGGDEPLDAAAPVDAPPDAANASSCVLAKPPARPAIRDDGVDVGPLVLAFHAFSFAPPGDAGVLGFDLDDTCTCPGGKGDAAAGPCIAGDPKFTCDDLAGRDIALVNLMPSAGSIPILDDGTQEVLTGRGATLVKIDRYNGAPDDPDVMLTFYLSSGTWATTSDGGAFLDDGGVLPDGGHTSPAVPAWDGNDTWSINPRSLNAGTPVLRIPGWVAGGVFVASAQRFPGFLVPSSFGTGFDVNDAIFTGRLVKDGGIYRVTEGQIAGRIPASQLLGAVRTKRTVKDGGAVTCSIAETSFYELVKVGVCGARDIMASATADGTGQSCDAISYAFSFDAVEAKLGLERQGPVLCANQEVPCP